LEGEAVGIATDAGASLGAKEALGEGGNEGNLDE
jgi:hypothetical protein